MDENRDRSEPRFADQIRIEPKAQVKVEPRKRFSDELKAQFKIVLRITGLMLCCAVLFMSGFYLGICQGGLDEVPEGGIITGTYTPPDTGVTAPAATPGTPANSWAPDATTTTASTSADAATATTAPLTGEATVAVVPPPTPEELLSTLKWPVAGKISREPGWVFSQELKQWDYFSGVEISCESGSEVVAALAGSIKNVEVDPALGTIVTLQHDSGLVTTYGRVQRVALAPGDHVDQGEAIGASGPDGLYFSITCQDEPLSARECLATAK